MTATGVGSGLAPKAQSPHAARDIPHVAGTSPCLKAIVSVFGMIFCRLDKDTISVLN